LGLKASEKTKQKMSESHKGLNTWSKGRKMSEEQKQNNQNFGFSNKDKPKSEETKRKISESLKGRKPNYLGCKHTEEQRKKISDSKKGEKHPLFGKQHKEETKQKMREAALNIPKLMCPYCNKVGSPHNMIRWHFNNCKNNK
jgi:hypothetical protein